MGIRNSVTPRNIVSSMTNLNDALASISAIRDQIARGTQFKGYGPASVAVSGVLALLVAALQSHWLESPAHDFWIYVAPWIIAAAISVILTGTETVLRARRVHLDVANRMIGIAAEQFVPALVVGMLLAVVVIRFTPDNIWMLPGLWQVEFSLGVFASCRFLPNKMFIVGVWYLSAGLTCLTLGAGTRTFLPWAMGIPFGVGQLLVAAVLQFGDRDGHG
jgi:hypothetical protein